MSLIRAAVLDLDDTVLRDDLTISPLTLDIFQRLHTSGFVFVIASGRTLMSMKPFTDRIGCASLCIACNGALIWDPATGDVLHRETFSAELGREIARFGNEFPPSLAGKLHASATNSDVTHRLIPTTGFFTTKTAATPGFIPLLRCSRENVSETWNISFVSLALKSL